jgi:hypothetical protein
MKDCRLILFTPANTPLPVTLLVPRDSLRIDPAPLSRLFVNQDDAGAEAAICHALEDIARRLHRIEDDHRACAFDRVATGARRMIGVANHIGLIEVAHVAELVADCAQAHNAIALGATIARLLRVSDRSMTDIWTVPRIFS